MLFGSDWSGSEDVISVDSYVAELPRYILLGNLIQTLSDITFAITQNPVVALLKIETNAALNRISIYDISEKLMME